jgi:hypothetical protein
VKKAYESVRQSLPAVSDFNGYLSSHQTAVAQLSLQYCNELVNDTSLRNSFFTGVDFSGGLTQAGGGGAIEVSDNGQALLDILALKAIGTGDAQPSDAEFNADMGDLLKVSCPLSAPCSGSRTVDVIKAACAASLGSAATLVQ